MSLCDESTSIKAGVDVRSRLMQAGPKCQVGDGTSHELVATNYGLSTLKVTCESSVLGKGVSYPEAENNSWTSERILPPSSPQVGPAKSAKALIRKPEEEEGDIAAIQTHVSIAPLLTQTGRYEAKPVVIFLKV